MYISYVGGALSWRKREPGMATRFLCHTRTRWISSLASSLPLLFRFFFFFFSGLLRESGGMAGRQQAHAGNHRHGHLGGAGKRLDDRLFFPPPFFPPPLLLSHLFSSPVFLLFALCLRAFVCVCLSGKFKKKNKINKNACIQWPMCHSLVPRKL